MPDIAVVDYGMGNLRSVAKALAHVAPDREIAVTSDPGVIGSARRVVLPGQSAMPDCMRGLDESGLRGAVMEATRSRPFLGICLGLQMLFDMSEEGPTAGLSILHGRVARFRGEAMTSSTARPPASAVGRDRGWQPVLFRAQLLSRTGRPGPDGRDGRLSDGVYLRHRTG